jgi:hypothetical protein
MLSTLLPPLFQGDVKTSIRVTLRETIQIVRIQVASAGIFPLRKSVPERLKILNQEDHRSVRLGVFLAQLAIRAIKHGLATSRNSITR